MPEASSVDTVSMGEMAGLMVVLATVNRAINKQNKARQVAKVPYMVYENLKWTRSPPSAHPTISVSIDVEASGYKEIGIKPPPPTRRRCADGLALVDTGCQVCCIGLTQLNAMGLHQGDLLSSGLDLKAANSTGIDILGVVFIVITGYDANNKPVRTKQTCYVASGVSRMMLSRKACQELGIIEKSFPNVGQYLGDTCQVQSATAQAPISTQCKPVNNSCSCPRRTTTPDPSKFDASLSREDLCILIMKHYQSSAFNRCSTQPLPGMTCAPLPIITDDSVKPFAAHTPAAIPIHWEEQVKKDLDRDVALGVIEPVPINTPVDWCARMLVVPKQDGSPRRTVDFSALNKASKRQTHHTKSPFSLASQVPRDMKKSVLDVWNAYHSVPVREEDQHKLTFITQWGRY